MSCSCHVAFAVAGHRYCSESSASSSTTRLYPSRLRVAAGTIAACSRKEYSSFAERPQFTCINTWKTLHDYNAGVRDASVMLGKASLPYIIASLDVARLVVDDFSRGHRGTVMFSARIEANSRVSFLHESRIMTSWFPDLIVRSAEALHLRDLYQECLFLHPHPGSLRQMIYQSGVPRR